ncbi:hypothetical protein BGX28_006105 [Mortierella sp. GBA30]|nr:hypothetical protein BGX28_006105 [Mortierella sp. GBA30]
MSGSGELLSLKITLKRTKPPVWRRIHVAPDINLRDLAEVLNTAMGWLGYHLHDFRIHDQRYARLAKYDYDYNDDTIDEKTVKLSEVAPPGSKIAYEYDFGDSWEHTVIVEKYVPRMRGMTEPYCVGGKRACPPEDCGSIPGYEGLIELMAGPDCEEKQEKVDWLGGEEFDPEKFSKDEVNEMLANPVPDFLREMEEQDDW